MGSPETSIIIRSFNEEKHLPGLFEGIRSQSYKDVEVIVVDSGSVDRTREIASQYCDKLVRINSVDFTYGYSLNTGIRNSKGQFVVIASAHTKPINDDWLASLVGHFHQKDTAMVFGKQVGWSTSKLSEAMDMARMFNNKFQVLKPPHFFANNANSAIRRDLWEDYPFDETLPGLEDIDWAKHWMEKGFQVVYEPKAAIYHIHEESWSQIHRRYYRESLSAKWIGVKGRRHIGLEVLRESKNLGMDLLQAAKVGLLPRRSGEIFNFRMQKTLGSVKGLWNGGGLTDPRRRSALFFNRVSKGVVIRGPGSASLEEVEIPDVKPGDVLIRVAYEGVCGTDFRVFDGDLAYYKNGQAKYPIIPGHEFSGVVVKVGPNVQHLDEGDPVVVECIQSCGECEECRRQNRLACGQQKEMGVIGCNGGYSEYVVAPGRLLHKVPDGMGLREAALCEPVAVAIKGINRLERALPSRKRKRCLVVGVGPIGHLCAKLLHSRGHLVSVYDRNSVRRSYFNGTGIQAVDNLEDVASYEVLVEATGQVEPLGSMVRHSAAGATLLLLGLPYSNHELDFRDVVTQDKVIVGSYGSGAEEFKEALELLPKLDWEIFTQKTFPLEQFAQAWEAFRLGTNLKIMLEVCP